MEQFTISAGDGAELVARRWTATPPIKAVVQIAHGAAEHLGRYDRLARLLTAQGYAVVGADHRGHGLNADVHGLGDFGPRGFAGVIGDMAGVTELARATFPNTPVLLLAHSFGSFAAQIYLMKHADLIDGLVLSGTAAVDLLLADADAASGMAAANAQFEPARTPFDWLSRDEQEVGAYIADPLCGFEFPVQSLASMAQVVAEESKNHGLRTAAQRDFPIYIISGEHDPIVGAGQSLSRALEERYRNAGITDVQHRIYPGGRHEMFNETNRDEVIAELLAWFDEHLD